MKTFLEAKNSQRLNFTPASANKVWHKMPAMIHDGNLATRILNVASIRKREMLPLIMKNYAPIKCQTPKRQARKIKMAGILAYD
jgi:hypothetical protein